MSRQTFYPPQKRSMPKQPPLNCPLVTSMLKTNKDCNTQKQVHCSQNQPKVTSVNNNATYIVTQCDNKKFSFSDWVKSVNQIVEDRFGSSVQLLETPYGSKTIMTSVDMSTVGLNTEFSDCVVNYLPNCNLKIMYDKNTKPSFAAYEICNRNYNIWAQLVSDYVFAKSSVFIYDLFVLINDTKGVRLRKFFNKCYSWKLAGDNIIKCFTKIPDSKTFRFFTWMKNIDILVFKQLKVHINECKRLADHFSINFVKEFMNNQDSCDLACYIIQIFVWLNNVLDAVECLPDKITKLSFVKTYNFKADFDANNSPNDVVKFIIIKHMENFAANSDSFDIDAFGWKTSVNNIVHSQIGLRIDGVFLGDYYLDYAEGRDPTCTAEKIIESYYLHIGNLLDDKCDCH